MYVAHRAPTTRRAPPQPSGSDQGLDAGTDVVTKSLAPRSTGVPFGSSSGQSSRRRPGTTRHFSPQPIVTSRLELAARLVSATQGRPDLRQIDADLLHRLEDLAVDSRARLRCRPRWPARPRGWRERWNHAAAICERPALWTQANRTVFMGLLLCDFRADEVGVDGRRLFGSSQRKRSVWRPRPRTACAAMKPGTSEGRIPGERSR